MNYFKVACIYGWEQTKQKNVYKFVCLTIFGKDRHLRK